MKWTISKNYCWYLKDYPFFDTTIKVNNYKGNQSYKINYVKFDNLKDAKSHIIKNIRKLSQVKDFSEIRSIRINDTGWPNNIGEGIYIKPYKKGERYIWVTGMYQPWRCSYNCYAIRFPTNTVLVTLKTV